MKKKVLLVSPLRSVSGYGTVSRGIYRILKRMEKEGLIDFDVMVLRWGTFSETTHLDDEIKKRVQEKYDQVYDVAIMVSSPYDYRYWNNIFRAKHLIFFNAMVETKPFHPNLFQQLFNFMLQVPTAHLVFPSSEIKKIWEEIINSQPIHPAMGAAVLSRIHVVPNPVDEVYYASTFGNKNVRKNVIGAIRKKIDEIRRSYELERVFLTLAPMGVDRKNARVLPELIEMVGRVGILVLAGGANSFLLYDFQRWIWIEGEKAYKRLPLHRSIELTPEELMFVFGSLTVEELSAVMDMVDGGINLSYGESWDYLLHNMMLLGKPCLYVDFFHRDYMPSELRDVLGVDFEMVPLPKVIPNIPHDHPFFHPQTMVAEANLNDAAEKLEWVLRNYDDVSKMIANQKDSFKTDDTIYEFLVDALESIEEVQAA